MVNNAIAAAVPSIWRFILYIGAKYFTICTQIAPVASSEQLTPYFTICTQIAPVASSEQLTPYFTICTQIAPVASSEQLTPYFY